MTTDPSGVAAVCLLKHTFVESLAEPEPELEPGSGCLADVSPRHRIWDVKKAASDVVAGIYAQAADPSVKKHSYKVLDCSQTLVLLAVSTGSEKTDYKATSWKCRERHCPICQSARVKKLHNQFVAVLPAILDQVPNGVFLFLTLTVQNCPITELRITLAEMGKAWKRLLRKPEFQIVKGWIRGTEVTRSADGKAHPHFHCLLLVPPSYFAGHSYIKHEKWVTLWQDVAHLNYQPIVDIRRVKAVQDGIVEAVKAATYSIKPAELETDPIWFHEFHNQVSGLRFLATGGVIKKALGVKANEEADDIADTDSEGEVIDRLIFTWQRPEKKYRRRQPVSG